MNSNFVAGAAALWEVSLPRVPACPVVSPGEAAQLLQPAVNGEEPLVGFRDPNHQVMNLFLFWYEALCWYMHLILCYFRGWRSV